MFLKLRTHKTIKTEDMNMRNVRMETVYKIIHNPQHIMCANYKGFEVVATYTDVHEALQDCKNNYNNEYEVIADMQVYMN